MTDVVIRNGLAALAMCVAQMILFLMLRSRSLRIGRIALLAWMFPSLGLVITVTLPLLDKPPILFGLSVDELHVIQNVCAVCFVAWLSYENLRRADSLDGYQMAQELANLKHAVRSAPGVIVIAKGEKAGIWCASRETARHLGYTHSHFETLNADEVLIGRSEEHKELRLSMENDEIRHRRVDAPCLGGGTVRVLLGVRRARAADGTALWIATGAVVE